MLEPFASEVSRSKPDAGRFLCLVGGEGAQALDGGGIGMSGSPASRPAFLNSPFQTGSSFELVPGSVTAASASCRQLTFSTGTHRCQV